MTKHYYLAIDQGGQSSRVGVYSESGKLVHEFRAACRTRTHTVSHLAHPYIEQDGDEILAGIRAGLDSVTQFLGNDVQRIRAAGYAGQGSSLLCWDAGGRALTPVISWQDIRGEPYLKDISLTHRQAQDITGLRASPHYGASKIRWCLDNNQDVKDALQSGQLHVGPVASFIFWHLLGPKNRIDPGHAQRTLLWNLHRNAWDERLLAMFGIPAAILPDCLYHDSHFGDLALGAHHVPLKAAARDQGASLFAAGLPDSTNCYVNMGTGAFVQRVTSILHSPEGLLVSPLWLSVNNVDCPSDEVMSPPCNLHQTLGKNRYAWEGTVNGAASGIPYIQAQTGLSVTPQEIEDALCLDLRSDVYFLNSLGGLGAPYWRTDVQPQFSAGLSPLEKIAAWIESLIFQIAINIELMKQAGELTSIRISGGLSQSDGVCQLLADVTGLAVLRQHNADATLQGVAFMAAGFSSQWNPVSQQERFLPGVNNALQKRFANWQLVMTRWLT